MVTNLCKIRTIRRSLNFQYYLLSALIILSSKHLWRTKRTQKSSLSLSFTSLPRLLRVKPLQINLLLRATQQQRYYYLLGSFSQYSAQMFYFWKHQESFLRITTPFSLAITALFSKTKIGSLKKEFRGACYKLFLKFCLDTRVMKLVDMLDLKSSP